MSGSAAGREPVYVFVHGFLGFDRLGPPRVGIPYFRNLAAVFAGTGRRWLVADGIPAGATVAARAEALAGFLERHDLPQVVLIAHSMGGLDCRHLIARLDPQRRVACLATIGTPHHGSPLAGFALRQNGPLWHLVRTLGRAGLAELTLESCAARNAALADRPDVRYLSLAGARPAAEQAWLFRTLLPEIMATEGAHDGLVAVASARWGEFLGTLRADHFELVGWDLSLTGLPLIRGLGRGRPRFDHVAMLRRLIDRTQQAT
jgi:triacylglycerol lipase